MCDVIFLSLIGISALSTILAAEFEYLPTPTEGAECECDGIKGICVSSRRCLSSLATHAMKDEETCTDCDKQHGEDIICCTDCSLVNDTRNAVVSPLGDKILWKDGRKSRDQCLDYLSRLPYKCRNGVDIGLFKSYDHTNECHNFKLWTAKALETPKDPSNLYPFQVRLGFVKEIVTLTWSFTGVIISEKFILTDAFSVYHKYDGVLKYIATNVKNYRESFLSWTVYHVKRSIIHPEYRNNYNNIALIETKKPIQFNENVLPLCLPSEDSVIDHPKLITGFVSSMSSGDVHAHSVDIRSEDECMSQIPEDDYLPFGYDHATHICGHTHYNKQKKCRSYAGEPLVVSSDISPCVSTVVGVVTFCHFPTQTQGFTRVSYFLPWIESIVWP